MKRRVNISLSEDVHKQIISDSLKLFGEANVSGLISYWATHYVPSGSHSLKDEDNTIVSSLKRVTDIPVNCGSRSSVGGKEYYISGDKKIKEVDSNGMLFITMDFKKDEKVLIVKI